MVTEPNLPPLLLTKEVIPLLSFHGKVIIAFPVSSQYSTSATASTSTPFEPLVGDELK